MDGMLADSGEDGGYIKHPNCPFEALGIANEVISASEGLSAKKTATAVKVLDLRSERIVVFSISKRPHEQKSLRQAARYTWRDPAFLDHRVSHGFATGSDPEDCRMPWNESHRSNLHVTDYGVLSADTSVDQV